MSGMKKKVYHSAVFKKRTKNDDNAELSELCMLDIVNNAIKQTIFKIILQDYHIYALST